MWTGMKTHQFCTGSVRTWVHHFDTIAGKDYSEIANLTISWKLFHLWDNKISFNLVFHPKFTETSQYTCPIDSISCRLLSATKQNEKAKFIVYANHDNKFTTAESDSYLLSCRVSDRSSQYHIERKHVLHLGAGIQIPRKRYCHLNST